MRTKPAIADTIITDRCFRIYVSVASIIFFLEMCIGITLTVHLPPPPEPWFMQPPKIIIPMPRNPYENDTWRNTWEERDV